MDRASHRRHVDAFIDSNVDRHTLGLVYGRRRIGKSTMLESITHERGGFYWEATRTETAVQLARLGEALGAHRGVGRLALESWEDAFRHLLRLGTDGPVPIVLDEFGHVLEAEPSADSVLAAVLGPKAQREIPGRARLILCGSAIAMLGALTSGQAPLRGRAGMELVMHPSDFREAARTLAPRASLELAARVYAAIGGVIGYATDMVDHDLPSTLADFDRWVTTRLLSPAATLHHEATTLLAEDPTLTVASPVIHHGVLGAIANGSVTAGKIANRLRRAVPNIEPALKRLIAAGFVVRHADPIRAQRPTYALADPFLQFHYAVLEPHGPLLRDREPLSVWRQRLTSVFDERVRGPVFAEQVRAWVRRFAAAETIGGPADHIGPSTAFIEGTRHQLDLVVATADSGDESAAVRTVLMIGEAKVGARVGSNHLKALERARSALGSRAAHAKLALFAPTFYPELQREAAKRTDVELVDLDRLYRGD